MAFSTAGTIKVRPPESRVEDIATAKSSNRPAAEIYRDLPLCRRLLRLISAFRWMDNPRQLGAIRTTTIVLSILTLCCCISWRKPSPAPAPPAAGDEDSQYDALVTRGKSREMHLWNNKRRVGMPTTSAEQ
ncbi:hypothetical protein KCP78_08010 [Salmonella enterica subsp. enterica]|nr:hypothetical protein KCP78_08010 [Salmonella enterica subsp. enterica]